MKFLIEKDYTDVEYGIILKILNRTKLLHEYEIVDNSFFYDIDENGKKTLKENIDEKYKEYIPIGTILFVNNYFKLLYGIEQQNPIEIPKNLRMPEFLKRNYEVVKAENLPRIGRKFIKDVSELKNFSYDGELEYFLVDEVFLPKKNEFDNTLRIDKDHLFEVSDSVNILSEYRIYIIGGEIVNISNYNGDTTIFPDINLIKKANNLYSLQKDYPKSYSFDVMVTNAGTSIIEVHTFSSLGLYHNLWGNDLLYAYKDAKDYTIKYNTKIEEFKVSYKKE